MPTLSVKKLLLFEVLDRDYTDDEFANLCFEFGIELDEVTTEKSILQKELGETAKVEGSDDVIYKIDIPANRYDLLCLEGLSTALLVFLNKMEFPNYRAVPPADLKSTQRLNIKPSTKQIRQFALAAVLRNITFTKDSYDSFIELQDKLHTNVARKRTLVAIGTHDLDTISGPFTYEALPPNDICFRPLNQDKEYTAPQIMELFSNHAQLKQYLHIIKDSPVYPIIKDSNGVVLSMPPIINGHHSRITLDTKNVFIEVTATDLNKAHVVLDTLVSTFSQYCKSKYVAEFCQVTLPDGTKVKSPQLPYRKETVNVKKLNNYIGTSCNAGEVASLLSRMCLTSKAVGGPEIVVKIPPTRHDILHAVDIYEDAAIAFGYNNITKTFPKTSTIGKQLPINKLSDQLRLHISQAGFTEGLTFSLCSKDDISVKLRKKLEATNAIHISNPKTLEFQVVRTTLLPGLLKTVSSNKSLPLPLKLFEISDIVISDKSTETGARNERHVCAVYYDKVAGFEKIHGLLDRTMQLLEVPWSKENGYYLNPVEDDTYFPKRCAEIVCRGKIIGKLGILHPEVITAFELNLPCSALEINIEPFL